MSAKVFSEFWKDDRVNSLAVYLQPDVSADGFSAEFRSKFSRDGEIAIYPNRDLRRRVFEIFDQTFAVTYVLRTIAVLVAIAGIFLTLATLVKERTRELGIFRAIGGSAPQVRGVLLWESAMIGLLAAAIGIVSGLCLSVVLTGVINRAFFGWTIQLAFPWASLAGTPLWIIGAALAAGVIPAWRASRMETAQAIRSE